MLSLSFPEERRVEASNLSSLLSLYLVETKKRVNAGTYKDYIVCLAPFQLWWNDFPTVHQHTLSDAIFVEFVRWYTHDYQPPAAESTTDYMLFKTTTMIRRFLRWMHQKGMVAESIQNMCPLHEYNQPEGKYYPTVDDLAAMFNACSGNTRLRDAALIAFLVDTGARRFEAAAVKCSDLRFDMDGFSIEPGNAGYVHLRVTKGDSDGKKGGRHSVFSHVTCLLLKLYMHSSNRRQGTLFGMTDKGIWHVIHHLAEAAQLPAMHPHAFRSLFIDWYSEAASDGGMMADLALRLQVGHTLTRDVTTAHYIDTRNKDKIIRRIRSFYTSPLLHLESKGDWQWNQWIVSV